MLFASIQIKVGLALMATDLSAGIDFLHIVLRAPAYRVPMRERFPGRAVYRCGPCAVLWLCTYTSQISGFFPADLLPSPARVTGCGRMQKFIKIPRSTISQFRE